MAVQYKYIGRNVPTEIREALETLIEELELECADNHRYAPMDDSEGLDQFEDLAHGGCCGSFERQILDSTGRQWLVGCNYGH